MGPLQKHHPQNGLFWNRLFGCFVICLQCPLLHSAWQSCSLQPFYTIGNWQFEELIAHATHYFQIPMKIAQNTTLFCRKRVSCHVFPIFCASNRAPDGSFRVQLFVPQIVLQMGLFRVQLFVLQIVLQIGLFACNFLCSKSCSRWSFRVRLFVPQIVLQMGLFACNFLCSKSCSRWVFSRATFCAPNRAPDGSFRVHFFGGPGAWKNHLVSFCMLFPICHCLHNYFFCRPHCIWQMVEQTKQSAAPAAFLSYFCQICRACFLCCKLCLLLQATFTYQQISTFISIFQYIYIYQHMNNRQNSRYGRYVFAGHWLS